MKHKYLRLFSFICWIGCICVALPAASQVLSTNALTLNHDATETSVIPEAWNLAFVHSTVIAQHIKYPIFSHACDKLAYTKSNLLSIKSLDNATTDVSFNLGVEICNFAWSPDDKRIFCLMSDRGLKVIDLNEGKIINLPVLYPGAANAGQPINWEFDNSVAFQGDRVYLGTVLNLETLQFYYSSGLLDQSLSLALTNCNPNYSFVRDGNSLFASSTKKDYVRLIPLAPEIPTPTTWSRNLRYVVSLDNDKLILSRVDVSTPSPTEFQVSKLVNADDNFVVNGGTNPLFANVYAAMINPLTGKPAGPAGEIKGHVKVFRRQGQLYASACYELKPFAVGDVIGSFNVGFNGGQANIIDGTIWGILENESSPPPSTTTSKNLPAADNKVLPAKQQSDVATSPDYRKIYDDLIASVPNSKLFDNHRKIFTAPYDQVWNSMTNVLFKQKEIVVQSDKDAGIIKTALTKHTLLGLGFYVEYCILVEKTVDSKTRVTFILLQFETNVLGQKIPASKNVIDQKAHLFEDNVSRQLEIAQ